MIVRNLIPLSLPFIGVPLISFFYDPQVQISQGILRGTTMKSKNGRYFSSFTGIPFAQPPIGELRFKSPLPAKAWDGVLSATSDVKNCPQMSKTGKFEGTEDCLYLNVFTPLREFKTLDKHKLLPVLIYIYGGGFDAGSSSIYSHGPNYLLDKDIILVTINYRLGIFGFLTTGDLLAPGNFGLKDQVLALKWVQKNIQSFGGDPKRVTLFGASSGAIAVHYHSLSNASNGLFHQYIFQSGTALSPWIYRKKSEFKPDIERVAKNIGCSTENSKILIKCLRNADAEKLVIAGEFYRNEVPKIIWTPTDELESKDAFLTDNPFNLMAQNKMKDYPFITGTVADEGLHVTAEFYKKPSAKRLESIFSVILNGMSKQYMIQKNSMNFNEIMREYYFKFNISVYDREFLKNFTDFVSDASFFYPTVLILEKSAKIAKSPFYLYRFNYVGDENALELDFGIKEKIGVPHGNEIRSLLNNLPLHEQSKRDGYITDIMVDLWTSFVINGKPTSARLKNPNLWQPYTKNNSFLEIGDVNNIENPSITLGNVYYTNRMNFWKKYFPILI